MIKRLLLLALLWAVPSFACTGTDTYSTLVCSYSPTHYWRMDASSGTTENDLGSLAANGTYVGTFTLNTASLLASISDKAVNFAGGVNSRVNASAAGGTANGPDTTNGVGWSVAAWVKFNSLAGNTTVFNRYGTQFQWFFVQLAGTPATINMQVYGASAGNGCLGTGTNSSIAGTTALSTGTSYFIVFSTVGNGTNIDGELILNGVSEGTFSNKPIAANSACSQALSISNTTDDAFKGNAIIDEVMMIPSRLTTTQALGLYNCGVSGTSCNNVSGLNNYSVKRELPKPQIFGLLREGIKLR